MRAGIIINNIENDENPINVCMVPITKLAKLGGMYISDDVFFLNTCITLVC